jgi:protein gp37
MASNSGIEWTDHTFNPWIGCTKVSPACDHCYAERQDHRFGGGHWGPGAPRKRTKPGNWAKPYQWDRQAEREGTRYRVFCASLADVFDNEIPAEWREDLWELIRNTPNLDWLLLTKRIGNAGAMLPEDWGDGWGNVWMGSTVVTQEEADRDIPKLLDTPAAVRFLSCEPLLEGIDLAYIPMGDPKELPMPGHELWPGCINALDGRWFPANLGPQEELAHSHDDNPKLDWVIAGGESGPQARPIHPDWVRSLRKQCLEAEVPFFFKQWGRWTPDDGGGEGARIVIADGSSHANTEETARALDQAYEGTPEWDSAIFMAPAGKKASGRQLDGETWDQVPGREVATA